MSTKSERIAAHMLRLPRLTLKAGRKAGYKAGYKAESPRDGRADRGKTQKSEFAKLEISKIANRENQNLENFHRNFFHEIDREIVSSKIAFLFSRSAARPSLLRSLSPFALCEVQT